VFLKEKVTLNYIKELEESTIKLKSSKRDASLFCTAFLANGKYLKFKIKMHSKSNKKLHRFLILEQRLKK
jgi:hypothetical protein